MSRLFALLGLATLLISPCVYAQESLGADPVSSTRPEAITDIPIAPASDGIKVKDHSSVTEKAMKAEGVKSLKKNALAVKAKSKGKSAAHKAQKSVQKAKDSKAFKKAVAKAKVAHVKKVTTKAKKAEKTEAQ